MSTAPTWQSRIVSRYWPVAAVGLGLAIPAAICQTLLYSGLLTPLEATQSGLIIELLLLLAFIAGLVVIIGGFALAFVREWRDSAALTRIKEQLDARVVELEQRHRADQQAIQSLVRAQDALFAQAQQAHPPPGIKEALATLANGDQTAAVAILQTIVDRKKAEGAAAQTARKEAAEAARHIGALTYFNDVTHALAAFREAAALDPDDVPTWIFIGRLELMQGRSGEAAHAYQTGLDVSRQLQDRPGEAVVLRELGDLFRAQGDLVGALSAYSGSQKIWEDLIDAQPANDDFKISLSIGYLNIGDILVDQTQLAQAVTVYNKAHELLLQMSTDHPNNINVQSNLAVNFERMAKVYRTVGDYKSALPYYEQSLAISAKLVETAPTDGLRLAALATAWQHVGDMRFELQDLERAVAAYDAFLEIVDRLANGDPANQEWQRRLSFARERIGDVRGAQGELDAARQAYSTALGIAQRVAATDPSNAIWQRDVIGAHVKIAETAESPSVAQCHYEQALTIARSLDEADLLPLQYHWMVPKLESRLASLTQTR